MSIKLTIVFKYTCNKTTVNIPQLQPKATTNPDLVKKKSVTYTKDFFAHGHSKSRALSGFFLRLFHALAFKNLQTNEKVLKKPLQDFFAGGKPPDPQGVQATLWA